MPMTSACQKTIAAALCALGVAACADSGGGTDSADAAPESRPDGGPDSPPDAAVPSADCDNLTALPASARYLDNLPASEDFTFDDEGYLVGVVFQTAALTRTSYAGAQQILVPGVSDFARGTRKLPGGDIVVADPERASLYRITPAGSRTTVLSGLPDPNGIAIHKNGFVYLSHGGGEVWRINPDNAEYARIVTAPGQSFDGITFSVDYRTLYYNEEVGTVHALPLDGDGNPTGPATIYATIPLVEILDGMTVDECDNLYVVEMFGTIWRVSPDGAVEKAVTLSDGGDGGGFGVFIPAVNFGSGRGGWKADSLYIMHFEGGMYEVDLGVRGKYEPHLPPL